MMLNPAAKSTTRDTIPRIKNPFSKAHFPLTHYIFSFYYAHKMGIPLFPKFFTPKNVKKMVVFIMYIIYNR